MQLWILAHGDGPKKENPLKRAYMELDIEAMRACVG
jgi:hypothetical protein